MPCVRVGCECGGGQGKGATHQPAAGGDHPRRRGDPRGGARLTVDGGVQGAEAFVLQGLDYGQGGAGGGAELAGRWCWRPLACGRG